MGKALTLLPLAVLLMSTKGCQTLEARSVAAAVADGQARAAPLYPDLPAACMAHVERVFPKLGEKVRWTQERWQVTADNRDRQADDCAAWGQDMQTTANIAH